MKDTRKTPRSIAQQVAEKATAAKAGGKKAKDDGVLFRAPNGKLYLIPADKLRAFEVDKKLHREINANPAEHLELGDLLSRGPGVWPLKK